MVIAQSHVIAAFAVISSASEKSQKQIQRFLTSFEMTENSDFRLRGQDERKRGKVRA